MRAIIAATLSFFFGFVFGHTFAWTSVTEYQLTSAYALCSTNKDVETISVGSKIAAHCTNGATFELKKEKP